MTKRAKIIIGVVIALLLGAGIAAGLLTSSGVSTKSSNQIKEDIEAALGEKDYFKDVQVKTYSGVSEEENPDTPADSAAIIINLSEITSDSFTEIATLLPEVEDMSAFYSIGHTADVENITSVSGFESADFRDDETVKAIAASLKVQDEYKSSFWEISKGNAEGDSNDKLKTQFVSVEDTVPAIRTVVDKILTPKMDVLPVTKSTLGKGSFAQFAAVDGKMENYDKGLEIALNFADAVFLDSEQVVLLGLGEDIQISYMSFRSDLDEAKVTQIAKDLNKDQLFQIKVVAPEEVPAAPESNPEATGTASPSATATESAKPTEKPAETAPASPKATDK